MMSREQFPKTIEKGAKNMKKFPPPKGGKMPGMGSKKGMAAGGKPAAAKAKMPEIPAFKSGGMVGGKPQNKKKC